jgi:hypothetical protein
MGIIKVIAACGLLLIAVTMAVPRIQHLTATGEEDLKLWYYDQSKQALYTVPRETIPPHKGIGGEKNDGVKAVVVANPGKCDDRTQQHIAYLETYTPEHKRLVEGIRAAREAGRAYDQPVPEVESGFYEKNTLVRHVSDPTWYDLTTTQGKRIIMQWRSEREPDGRSLEVCTP